MMQTGDSLDGFPQSWQTFAGSIPPKCFESLVLTVSSSAGCPERLKRSCIEGCEQ